MRGIWICLVLLAVAVRPLRSEEVESAGNTTLTLQEAERYALVHHPEILAANFGAQAAEQRIREARSDFFPKVVANFSAVGADANTRIAATGGLNNPTVISRQSDGLSISQMITDFGRTYDLTSSSRYSAYAAEKNADAIRSDILQQVDQAYFTALGAKALLEVAEKTVATRQLLLNQVQALAKSKLKSGLDESFSRVNLAEAKLILLQAREKLNESNAVLAAAMGTQECQNYVLSEEPLALLPPDLKPLIQKALDQRPDIIAAKAERDAARKFLDAERSAQYPEVSALGAVGITPIGDKTLKETYAAAGVNVGLPLIDGGKLSARSQEAEYKAKAAEQVLNTRENRVARDVQVAWLQAQTAYQRIEITNELLGSADSAFDLAQSRYKLGVSSVIELSEAELEKTRAEIDHTVALYEYQIKRSALDYQTADFNLPK